MGTSYDSEHGVSQRRGLRDRLNWDRTRGTEENPDMTGRDTAAGMRAGADRTDTAADLRDQRDPTDRTERMDPVERRDQRDERAAGMTGPTAAMPAAAPANPRTVPAATTTATTAADLGLDRPTVVARERARYGGVKIGSAFFGWLTATGMAVLLTALLAGIGVAVGLGVDTTTGEVVDQARRNANSVSVAGAVSLIVIMFLAYYCGGYVAGRMARFNGAKQGLAVWLWALLTAVVVAIVAATVGDRFNLLDRLNAFPRLPINAGNLAVAGVITAVILAVASLVGAILGGLGGMRFHRRVDRVGLEPAAVTTDERIAERDLDRRDAVRDRRDLGDRRDVGDRRDLS